MTIEAKKPHIISTAILVAAALGVGGPLATLGAYGDQELSADNRMQAGEWNEEVVVPFVVELDEFNPQSLSITSDTPEPEGEVAGAATEEPAPAEEPLVEEIPAVEEEPVVEISEPVVEITEPVVEETPPVPEPEPTPEPAPEPEFTPSTEPAP